MIWLLLALALFAVALGGVVWSRRRRRSTHPVLVPVDLVARLEAATRALAEAEPWRPAVDPAAPEAAAAIETALIEGDRERALATAEAALAAADRPATHVWLAWALCANAEPAAALAQLAHARERDPALGDGALARYLLARAEYLRFEHLAGATAPIPALITTADLAVVTLASGRGAATWLKGTTDVELSATQARAAVAEHREITGRCLARALDALAAAPGFTDAGYLAARLAVKAGLLAPARALFDVLVPRMAGRPDADAFDRDRTDLADPALAVAAAKVPPPPGKGKRSRSLKVLS